MALQNILRAPNSKFLFFFVILFVLSSVQSFDSETDQNGQEPKLFKLASSSNSKKLQTHSANRGQAELASDALRMLAISQEYETMGSVLLSKLPQFQEKLVRLYTEALGTKLECRWALSERQGWPRTFEKMKYEYERHLNTTLFGFFETFQGSSLTKGAVTQPATSYIETLATAVHQAGVSNFIVEKFAGFLREKMIRRQQRFHSCTWNLRDRREAREGINELYHKFLVDMSQQVSRMSQFLQTDEIKLKGTEGGYWSQKMYGTLFQIFDQADGELYIPVD